MLDLKYSPSPPLSRSALAAEVWAEGDEGEDFEQHLRADHRGVGGGVVFRGHLDDVAADDVEALEAVQDRLGLARGQAAGLGGAGAGRRILVFATLRRAPVVGLVVRTRQMVTVAGHNIEIASSLRSSQ